MAIPAAAQSYYVRPLFFYGDGGLIDGVRLNGPTVATQSFDSNGTSLSAAADLGV